MKKLAQVSTLILFCAACYHQEKYNPDLCLPREIQTSLIQQSVRYSAKLPPSATQENKFSTEFNAYYEKAAEESDLRYCFRDGDKTYYFLMTRKAKSIWPAREGIGGKITIGKGSGVVDYEEIFRTWKMAEDSLNDRAFELFELMVKKEDLTPYRSKYKGDRYIEFPDDRYYFNTEKKVWSDRLLDAVRSVN